MANKLILIVLLSAIAQASLDDVFYGEYKFSEEPLKKVNLLPPIRNNNLPHLCHASWAFAITSVMSALFNKAKKGAFPEVVLSPQMLIQTRPKEVGFSCNEGLNGTIEQVLDNLKVKGVSDEGCNNFHGNDTHADGNKLAECQDCHNGEDQNKDSVCEFVPYESHKLKSYRKIVSTQTNEKDKNEDLKAQVIKSLNDNGPLLCRMEFSSNLFKFRTKNWSFWEDKGNELKSWFMVTGYSKTLIPDKQILIVQTSFGENVGYNGNVVLELKNGENPLNIFTECYELIINPETEVIKLSNSLPSYHSILKKVKSIRGRSRISLNQGLRASFSTENYNEGIQLLKEATPVDWRNHEGRNYLTYTKNQHIPIYCGSCWSQAAVSLLADKLNIDRIRNGKHFPKTNLAVQAIINCKVGGSCFGGDTSLLFQKAKTFKIPVETCATYQSKNPKEFSCSPADVCSLNTPTEKIVYDKFSGVTVKSYKRVRGADFMKAELANGPIACGFQVTEKFVSFFNDSKGKVKIWTEGYNFVAPNHEIEVVGWGVHEESKIEYWIVRNSWGKEWGDNGFFYIEAGKNLLGFESECTSAEVEYIPFE